MVAKPYFLGHTKPLLVLPRLISHASNTLGVVLEVHGAESSWDTQPLSTVLTWGGRSIIIPWQLPSYLKLRATRTPGVCLAEFQSHWKLLGTRVFDDGMWKYLLHATLVSLISRLPGLAGRGCLSCVMARQEHIGFRESSYLRKSLSTSTKAVHGPHLGTKICIITQRNCPSEPRADMYSWRFKQAATRPFRDGHWTLRRCRG